MEEIQHSFYLKCFYPYNYMGLTIYIDHIYPIHAHKLNHHSACIQFYINNTNIIASWKHLKSLVTLSVLRYKEYLSPHSSYTCTHLTYLHKSWTLGCSMKFWSAPIFDTKHCRLHLIMYNCFRYLSHLF